MALQKQSVQINFIKGLDTKTDPWQVQVGNFLSLSNTIFQKGGMLQKRNGFDQLTSLPDQNSTYLTTFNSNLTAIGQDLFAYSQADANWINKGLLQPIDVSVYSAVRDAYGQTMVDMAVSADGLLTCLVYTDLNGNCYYRILDVNGQDSYKPTQLPSGVSSPRVAALGNYFLIVFVDSAKIRLQYIAIPASDAILPSSTVTITSALNSSTPAYDMIVANNDLYISFNSSTVGGSLDTLYITQFLNISATKSIASVTADIISIAPDSMGSPNIYITFFDGINVKTTIYSNQLSVNILAPTTVETGSTIEALTSVYVNGKMEIFYQTELTYSYASSYRTDYISKNTITQGGAVGSPTIIQRGAGLISKAFAINNVGYLLLIYNSAYQPSYFLINDSGNLIGHLAYSNAAQSTYAQTQVLPSVYLSGSVAQIPYLFQDFVAPANKNQGTSMPATYVQTGINVASFNFSPSIVSSEIGMNLHVSGGILWMYDGVMPIEHGFELWPDLPITTAESGTSGSMTDQQYYYQVTYEWTDNQGNIHRSAPSIPISMNLTAGSAVDLDIPTLRFTYKTNVKICIYRWSAGQQEYLQVTSITSPLINNPSVDFVTYTDTLADTSIEGNVLLYTTGGVVEDIVAPPTSIMTLFKSRLVLVDAEDPNLLWYSKQVIEGTPVELSDLFTIYVAPTTSIETSSGPITALFAMDDKLLVFKKDAIYYITGNGPDNTGANNDFSDPIFISSTVGCTNKSSLALIPQGVVFQSDKGIWLLGRDLSTTYIGAPVETYNGATVRAALAVPGTNQIRLALDTGITLMYDYYYQQWGTFTGDGGNNLAATIYQSLHTFIDPFARVYQENPGVYLDGANPVLMSFTTSWFNLAGLQGYERAYYFWLLANYISPHKISVGIAYNYNASIVQTSMITPDNQAQPYGDDPLWGSYGYGGQGLAGNQFQIEQWRVFLRQQKCESFQLTIQELYDISFGQQAGAGFTMSGIDLIVGTKLGYPKMRGARSVG